MSNNSLPNKSIVFVNGNATLQQPRNGTGHSQWVQWDVENQRVFLHSCRQVCARANRTLHFTFILNNSINLSVSTHIFCAYWPIVITDNLCWTTNCACRQKLCSLTNCAYWQFVLTGKLFCAYWQNLIFISKHSYSSVSMCAGIAT